MSKSETVLSNSKILLDSQNITILDALSSSRSDIATQIVMNNMNMNSMNMNSRVANSLGTRFPRNG